MMFCRLVALRAPLLQLEGNQDSGENAQGLQNQKDPLTIFNVANRLADAAKQDHDGAPQRRSRMRATMNRFCFGRNPPAKCQLPIAAIYGRRDAPAVLGAFSILPANNDGFPTIADFRFC